MVDVSLGRAVLDLVTDPTKMRAGLAAARTETLATLRSAQGALHDIGSQMTQTGSQMTKGITVPVLAAGAAIFQTGADFETALDHIVGLVGIGRDQVNAWVPEIEKLGVATGKGPTELANALYFITSAGLRGQDALDALTASAKASAAGLGDTAVVANAVTSAVNAYAKSGLTAANATDVLVATVREGKTSAEDLAPVLGRIIPVAAALNISFGQVGGTLALMTRVSGDAAGAATSLGAIMSTLLKPSKEAAQTLADAGLSMQQLRQMAAQEPDGLYQALKLLDNAFGDNEEALAKVVPNVRAFRGVLSVLGQDASVVEGVLKDTANATGLTDKAFQSVADSAQHKVDVALSKLADDAILLGKDVLPVVVRVVEQLVDIITGGAAAFERLPAGMRDMVVQGLALLAFIGPLLVLLGAVVGSIGGLVGAAAGLASFLTVTLIPAIAGGLTFAIEGLATMIFASGIPALESLAVGLLGVEAAAGPVVLVLAAVAGAIALMKIQDDDRMRQLVEDVGRLEEAGKLSAAAWDQALVIAHQSGKGAADLRQLVDAWEAQDKAQRAAAESADLAVLAEHAASERADETAVSQKKVAKAYVDSGQAAKDMQKALHDAVGKALADEQKFAADSLATIRSFRTDIESAFGSAKDAAADAAETQIKIKLQLIALAAADDDYAKHHKGWTQEQILQYKLQRIGILKELTELKLHAALIGTTMQQQQALQALLTSKDMKTNLTSKFPEVKAAYENLRDTTLLHLWELAQQSGPAGKAAANALKTYLDPKNPLSPLHGSGSWGGKTAQEWVDALAAIIAGSVAPGGKIRRALFSVRGALVATSPPGPESPLHEVPAWGERTGMAWVLPLVAAIAQARTLVQAPLGALASHLQGDWAPRGLQIAAAAVGANGAGSGALAAAGAGHRATWGGPLIGSLHVDARGHTDPAGVGTAVKQAVHDAITDTLRDQSLRYVGGGTG